MTTAAVSPHMACVPAILDTGVSQQKDSKPLVLTFSSSQSRCQDAQKSGSLLVTAPEHYTFFRDLGEFVKQG